MKTASSQEKRCGRCDGQYPQLHYIYDLLEATCPPCYMEQYMKLQNLKKYRQKLEPQIVNILPGLYLGNEDAAIDPETVKKYNIKSICACGHFLSTPLEGVDYKRFLIGDYEQQNIKQYFTEFNEWLQGKLSNGKNLGQNENKGGNVLVHCSAGISRSSSFIIAYLISRRGMSYERAYDLVKKQRDQIEPNPGFARQLREYEEEMVDHGEG